MAVIISSLTALYLMTANDPEAGLYAGLGYGLGGNTRIFDNGGHISANSQSYSLLVGAEFPKLIRAELEYNRISTTNGHLGIPILNAYFKIPSSFLTPYVGGGIGAIMNGSVNNIDTNTTMAYQGILGVTYKIPDTSIKLDAEGRTLYSPNYYTISGPGGGTRPDFLQYDFRIKARYLF